MPQGRVLQLERPQQASELVGHHWDWSRTDSASRVEVTTHRNTGGQQVRRSSKRIERIAHSRHQVQVAHRLQPGRALLPAAAVGKLVDTGLEPHTKGLAVVAAVERQRLAVPRDMQPIRPNNLAVLRSAVADSTVEPEAVHS